MGKESKSLESHRNCLIVFAKEPKLGKVKTRLKTVLTDQQCLELYKAFLKDTKAIVRRVNCPLKILAYDSYRQEPYYLKRNFPKFVFHQQIGNNLGSRMHNAFRWAKNIGSQNIVIIGSDAPTLPSQYIQQAFDALIKNDLVLGPSDDGGYYLIGLKIPNRKLFQNIIWSSSNVLKKTLSTAKRLKINFSVLEKHLDIDDDKSLKELRNNLLKKSSNEARWTKKFLRSIKT